MEKQSRQEVQSKTEQTVSLLVLSRMRLWKAMQMPPVIVVTSCGLFVAVKNVAQRIIVTLMESDSLLKLLPFPLNSNF